MLKLITTFFWPYYSSFYPFYPSLLDPNYFYHSFIIIVTYIFVFTSLFCFHIVSVDHWISIDMDLHHSQHQAPIVHATFYPIWILDGRSRLWGMNSWRRIWLIVLYWRVLVDLSSHRWYFRASCVFIIFTGWCSFLVAILIILTMIFIAFVIVNVFLFISTSLTVTNSLFSISYSLSWQRILSLVALTHQPSPSSIQSSFYS